MGKKVNGLVELRKRKGLTQLQLAEECNLTRPYICQIEAGKKTPSLEAMVILAEVLNVSTIRIFKMFTSK